jgi:hypothetical protein
MNFTRRKKRTGDGMERKKERKESDWDRIKGQMQKPHTQVNEEFSLDQGT